MIMKFLMVIALALVAVSVALPPSSQAGEIDGKAVMCEADKYLTDEGEISTYSNVEKQEGRHLRAYIFGYDLENKERVPDFVFRAYISIDESDLLGRSVRNSFLENEYKASMSKIEWPFHRLDRQTLQLKMGITWKNILECELIYPDEIKAYFQPYIDYGHALELKIRSENKL